MNPRLLRLLALTLALAACAPAATPAPQTVPQPTSLPAPAVPAATQVPTLPSEAIRPPASGGVVLAPTRTATATPSTVPSVTSSQPGWTRVAATNPPPVRYDHTLTLDPANNKLVLFGGREGSQTLGDTWIYDLTSRAWRAVKSSAAPEARFGHAAAYDAKSRRVLIFAGQASGFFTDVWAFDTSAEKWQKLATKGSAPAARYGTSAVIDTNTNQLVITHGFATGRFDDTFALDLAANTWTQIVSSNVKPLKRCLHESVYDAQSDRMLLFGGCSSGFGPCPQGDLWSLDVGGKTWREVKPGGIKPSARSTRRWSAMAPGTSSCSAAKPAMGRMPTCGSSTFKRASGPISHRRAQGRSALQSRRRVEPAAKQMIVFGGLSSAGALNNLWVFTP